MGQFPDDVIVNIGRGLVHKAAVGQKDIDGNDFGDIFAAAVNGQHRASPLGLADVVKDTCAWSVKTVQGNPNRTGQRIRTISGRNSPDYSAGIENPHADPAITGQAVLAIWNARVDEALRGFNQLRVAILVRNFQNRNFLLFEEDTQRYNHSEFTWEFNKNANLEGSSQDGTTRFTWQPHGSQFTIHRVVPESAKRFSINREIPLVEPDAVINAIGFNQSWITIHGQG